jgi:hypothetical protein
MGNAAAAGGSAEGGANPVILGGRDKVQVCACHPPPLYRPPHAPGNWKPSVSPPPGPPPVLQMALLAARDARDGDCASGRC